METVSIKETSEQTRNTKEKTKIMRQRIIVGLILSLSTAIFVSAQDPPPSDVRDLVGARAAGGETQLRDRGYSFVKAEQGDDRTWTNWWNSRANVCITVATMEGRYSSIVKTSPIDCNRSGSSGGYRDSGGYYAGNTQDAISDCQTEGRYRLNSDLGGGGYGSSLTFDRNPSTNQVSAAKIFVNGSGRFAPGGGARSRPFKYSCIYSAQGHQVSTFNYEFVDPNSGYQNQPAWNDYRLAPAYDNKGRVWYSGGIINRNSGKGLDVENRGTHDKANIQQWEFAGQPNQRWDVIDLGGGQYSIISQFSNKALDVAGESERDGANVQQFRWNGGDNQRWYLRRQSGGYYQIVNVHSGKCLDVSDRSNDDGANVQQWSCSGGSNQAWKFGR